MNLDILLNREKRDGARFGEYYVCCPYCLERVGKVDTKFKLGVSLNKKVAHCFRCGIVLRFDKDKGIDQATSFIDNEDIDTVISSLSPQVCEKEESETLDLDIISIPLNKEETPFAYAYIGDRGILEEEIGLLNIRVGREYTQNNRVIKKWCGRVLFPFIEDEKVKFIVGRDYVGREPKYLNSTGNKSSILYKVGDFSNNTCIMCEGIISAISARRYTGIGAVCTLGKYPSETQLLKIRNMCDTIYFSYDADVEKKVKDKVISSLVRHNFNVKIVNLIEEKTNNNKVLKDPDDFKEKYLYFFNNAENNIV